MKLIWSLIFLATLAFSWGYFSDRQAERKVYEFCKSFAVGNSIESMRNAAVEQQLILQTLDSGILRFSKAPILPMAKTSNCEVHHQAGKISQMFFVKIPSEKSRS